MLHFRPLFSLVFHIFSLDFLFDHHYILLLDCINSKSVCRCIELCFPVSFSQKVSGIYLAIASFTILLFRQL